MLGKILFCVLLAIGRRLWGGAWDDLLKKLHLPVVSRTWMMVFYIPYIAIYLGNTYLTWFIGIWVGIFFALSFNNWWNFCPRRGEDQELDWLLKKIYTEDLWYSALYDYTGMILHFTLCSIPLLLYNTYACYNGIVIPLAYAMLMPRGKNEIAELIFGFSIGFFLLI